MSVPAVPTIMSYPPIRTQGRELFRKGTALHTQHAAPTSRPSNPSVVPMEKQ